MAPGCRESSMYSGVPTLQKDLTWCPPWLLQTGFISQAHAMFLTNHQPYPASHSKTQARQHLEYKDWDIKFNPRSQSKQTASNTSSSLLLRRFPAKSRPGDVTKHWRLPFRVDCVGPGNNRAANCWGQVATCWHGMTSPLQLGMIRTGRLHWKSLESPRSPWTNQSIIHRYALNSGKSSSYKMKLFFLLPKIAWGLQ